MCDLEGECFEKIEKTQGKCLFSTASVALHHMASSKWDSTTKVFQNIFRLSEQLFQKTGLVKNLCLLIIVVEELCKGNYQNLPPLIYKGLEGILETSWSERFHKINPKGIAMKPF